MGQAGWWEGFESGGWGNKTARVDRKEAYMLTFGLDSVGNGET